MKPDTLRRGWVFPGLLLCCASFAADMQPFHARYAIYRNGQLAGKANVNLSRDGDLWVMHTEGVGTHGLGRILRVSDSEHVEGNVTQGRFLPLRYTHHTRVAGIDRDWTAYFDWPNSTVYITKGNNQDALPLSLEQGGLDALSLKLELQRRLEVQDPDMVFHMVDEERIKEQQYRVLPSERIETSLGCLNTIPVTRLRTNSTRYTRAWHSPDIDFFMVRMEHGKTNGDHMEMRITELVVDGKPIAPLASCSALQGSLARP